MNFFHFSIFLNFFMNFSPCFFIFFIPSFFSSNRLVFTSLIHSIPFTLLFHFFVCLLMSSCWWVSNDKVSSERWRLVVRYRKKPLPLSRQTPRPMRRTRARRPPRATARNRWKVRPETLIFPVVFLAVEEHFCHLLPVSMQLPLQTDPKNEEKEKKEKSARIPLILRRKKSKSSHERAYFVPYNSNTNSKHKSINQTINRSIKYLSLPHENFSLCRSFDQRHRWMGRKNI